jgi:predicted RNA-binding Zn-ribbon protein involved in translation (DUF1610 family)
MFSALEQASENQQNMENAPEINKENINRFLCPNCGGNMVFDAKKGKLACPYCAYSQEIAADGTG